MLKLLSSILATVVFLALATSAQAQYPPPAGNLTPQGPTSSPPNSIIEVTCTLRDTAGDPISNELIFFSLSDPSGDAQLQKTSGLSDDDGQVEVPLFVGSFPGEIEVVCSAGDLQATYVAQVLGLISPPQTGDAGLAGTTGSNALVAIVSLVVVFGLATALRRTFN